MSARPDDSRQTAPRAAIRFHPTAYDVGQARLFGLNIANNGLLRAVVEGREDGAVAGYGPAPQLEATFRKAVHEIDPGARTEWALTDNLERLAAFGVAHRPDPLIGQEARMRQWGAANRYSITGVTHAISSILPDIASLVSEPLMSWDALICPSPSVREAVRRVHEAEADYLRWRHGGEAAGGPQLAVIPLGVHCRDFVFEAAERADARAALNIAPDDVVVLYVGRLSMLAKAHPGQAYMGLQAAAERSGRRIRLIECGHAGTPDEARVFEAGAAMLCPDVAVTRVDGRGAADRRRCWAAADIFLTLADNVQESFGLTPVEAMASGLPVIVSDWDGYRDTVREGLDGFRIPTWSPEPGAGNAFARAFQGAGMSTDLYNWSAAASTSVEMSVLVDRLCALAGDADLRRRMGKAGQARARAEFDWSRIYGCYRELWAELTERRLADGGTAGPRRGGQLEPFTTFGHYPTAQINAATVAELSAGAKLARYEQLAQHALFPFEPAPRAVVTPLWQALETGATTAGTLARTVGRPLGLVLLTLGALAKMGLVTLHRPAEPQ